MSKHSNYHASFVDSHLLIEQTQILLDKKWPLCQTWMNSSYENDLFYWLLKQRASKFECWLLIERDIAGASTSVCECERVFSPRLPEKVSRAHNEYTIIALWRSDHSRFHSNWIEIKMKAYYVTYAICHQPDRLSLNVGLKIRKHTISQILQNTLLYCAYATYSYIYYVNICDRSIN